MNCLFISTRHVIARIEGGLRQQHAVQPSSKVLEAKDAFLPKDSIKPFKLTGNGVYHLCNSH